MNSNNNNESSNISDSSNNHCNDSNISDTINFTNTYNYVNCTTPTKQHIITTIPNAPKKTQSYNRILFRRNKPQLSVIEE